MDTVGCRGDLFPLHKHEHSKTGKAGLLLQKLTSCTKSEPTESNFMFKLPNIIVAFGGLQRQTMLHFVSRIGYISSTG